MSYQLKPCPWCGSTNLTQGILGSRDRTVVCGCGASLTSLVEPGSSPVDPAWNTRALDEASYRAGLEAAAKVAEKMAKPERGDLALLFDLLAHDIRSLPTPSTIPESGA